MSNIKYTVQDALEKELDKARKAHEKAANVVADMQDASIRGSVKMPLMELESYQVALHMLKVRTAQYKAVNALVKEHFNQNFM